MRTFSVQTLGCKVNQYESEQLTALLRARGLQLAGPDGAADLRIINSCSVTTEAAAKSRQLTRRAARAEGGVVVSLPQLPGATSPAFTADAVIGAANRADRRGSRVVVTGCWATSDRAAAEAIAGVDAVIGHHQDVAVELIRLLDLWQGSGEEHATHSSTQHVPEPSGIEGWMNEAGSPAGKSTDRITLSYESEVNGKILPEVLSFRAASPAPHSHELACSQLAGGELGGRELVESVASAEPVERRLGTINLPLLSSRQTGRQRAHLKIQDGCDAHCTYCIIPSLRPGLWSKPIADVVAEATRLVAAGHVELVLTGIFLGAYGHPTALRRRRQGFGSEVERAKAAPNIRNAVIPLALRGSRETPDPPRRASGVRNSSSNVIWVEDAPPLDPKHSPLAQLTDALCHNVPGLKRLRFSSLEPGDLDADLIAALRSHPQVVPHFHLPLQSGSNALLRRMNRQYTREDYLGMVDRVRDAFDRPALTTDIIVGFPGETDAEFERTLEVVRHCRFIHIHAFPFSPRPGTAAARWKRQFVPGSTVNGRIETLRSMSSADSVAYRMQFIGQTAQLLVERERGEGPDIHSRASLASSLRHGRCERYFPVSFDDRAARPGDLVRARIDRVEGGLTFGTKVPG